MATWTLTGRLLGLDERPLANKTVTIACSAGVTVDKTADLTYLYDVRTTTDGTGVLVDPQAKTAGVTLVVSPDAIWTVRLPDGRTGWVTQPAANARVDVSDLTFTPVPVTAATLDSIEARLDALEAGGTGGGGGGGGTTDHRALTNRNAADQHPIVAVTGLQGALDGKADADHTHTSSSVTDLVETVDDRVAALIKAGSGMTMTYDDAAGTLTLTSTAVGGTTDPEIVRDVIGAALVAGSGVQVTVDDAGDKVTIAVAGLTAAQIPNLDAAKITSGTLALARIPTGTTSSTVALGNHTHAAGDLSGVVKTVNGTAPDAEGNVAVSGGGSVGRNWIPDVWCHPGFNVTSSTNNEVRAGNILFFDPVYILSPGKITSVAVSVATASTSTSDVARLGIYSATAAGGWSRVADLGTVTIGSTGDKIISGLSVALAGSGMYAIGYLAQSQATLKVRKMSTVPVYGTQSPFTQNLRTTYQVAQAYGALPAAPSLTGEGGYTESFAHSMLMMGV